MYNLNKKKHTKNKKSDDWRKMIEPIDLDFMPVEFELVKVLYEDDVQQVLWWTGSHWDGMRTIREKKIIAWKYTA